MNATISIMKAQDKYVEPKTLKVLEL